MLLLLLACARPPECPTCEDLPASQKLADWEAPLLAPYLEDLRLGIRQSGEQGFGICQGKRSCDAWVGPSSEELPAGDYLIRAELKVPQLASGWKVSFHIDCTLTAADGRTTSQVHDRDYDVRAVTKEQGFRLQPLWMIQSPHPNGARDCSFSLTPHRPDGVAAEAWTGHYKTPAPPTGT